MLISPVYYQSNSLNFKQTYSANPHWMATNFFDGRFTKVMDSTSAVLNVPTSKNQSRIVNKNLRATYNGGRVVCRVDGAVGQRLLCLLYFIYSNAI